MTNRKKSIAITIFAFGLLLANPHNAKAVTCKTTLTSFYNEATSRNDPRSVSSSYETCISIEGATIISASGINASSMTVSDCERYRKALESRNDASIGQDKPYCNEYGDCVNSGNVNNFAPLIEAAGGCDTFVNNYMVDSSANVSTNVSSAAARECASKGGVAVKIDRNYNITNGDLANRFRDENGVNWNFVGNTLDAEITYEVDGDECLFSGKKIEIETECVLVPTGASETIGMGCSGDASGSGEYSAGLSKEQRDTIKKNLNAKEICNDDAKISSNGTYGNFIQNGYGKSSFGDKVHAGGGVKASFKFTTTAYWEWCGEATSYKPNPHAVCTRTEVQLCPDGFTYNSSEGNCTKQTTSTRYVSNEKNCSGTYDSQTKECTTTSTETQPRCSTYENFECDEEDIETANKLAFEKANDQSKEMGTTGKVTARDSNDHTDATEYRIDEGEHQAGTLSGGGGSGTGSWPVGSSRSGTVSFSLFNTCIDIYNPFTVKYVANGQCDNNEIEGGAKYYIPLRAGTKNDPTGIYPFKATVDSVSILTGLNWKLEVSCQFNYTQKMFDEGDGSGRKYDYRPIDMSNPFPNASGIGTIPSNWQLFMSKQDLINKYMNKNNVEYEVDLTLEDINKIKQLSNSCEYRYSDLRTISPEGKSNELDDYGIKIENNNYNELGKCIKDCW